MRETCDFDNRVIPRDSTSLSVRRVLTHSRYSPARFAQCGRCPQGRDHGRQGRLGAPAALQQPVREVGAGAQFGDRHVHRPDPGGGTSQRSGAGGAKSRCR